MRVLKVTRCFYPAVEYGGPIGKMLAIGRGLIQRGHSVTVYASNLLNPGEKMSNETLTREVDNIQVVYLNSLFNYHWDPFTPAVFGLCRKELKKFDIIHIYGYRDLLSTFVSHCARKWGIPYIFEPMGMFIAIVRSHVKKRVYDFLFGRRLVAGAERIIVTSEQEHQELLICGVRKEKLFLRRNGIDLSEFENLPAKGNFRKQYGLDKKAPLVLYLGRIAWKKSIDLLIRAIEDLEGVELAVVGPDDGDGYLEKLVRVVEARKLKEKVIFTGPLYNQQKFQAFVDADLFVLPSQNENFGNAVAEAAACRIPVIVTNRCGIASYVKDRVGLVVKPDEGEIRGAIHRLLVDKQLREKFIQNTAQVKKELSWDEPIEELERLYKDIVGIQ